MFALLFFIFIRKYLGFFIVFICKSLCHNSFKLNIVNFSRDTEPIKTVTVHPHFWLHFISQFIQNPEFRFLPDQRPDYMSVNIG